MQWVHQMWPAQKVEIEKFHIIFYYLFPRHIFTFAYFFNIGEKLFYANLF